MQIGTLKTGFIGAGEYDIPEDAYHADQLAPTPSLSASIAKVMTDTTPLHAFVKHRRLNPDFERKEEDKFDLGKAFHKLILGRGAELAVLDYKDWRTDAAKAAKAAARKAHKIPLLREQHERAQAMVRAVRPQLRYREELALAMNGGVPERVLMWEEETPSGPVWCRMMADWIPHGGTVLIDWKSTGVGAGPDDWGRRTIWDIGCDVQDVFYRRGIRAVLGKAFEAVLFAVAETDEPHAIMCHRISPAAQAMAERKVQWAINAFGMCLHHKRWPGYPTQTAWQDPPPWIEGRWLERETTGAMSEEALAQQMAIVEAVKDVKPQPEKFEEVTAENPFGLKQ